MAAAMSDALPFKWRYLQGDAISKSKLEGRARREILTQNQVIKRQFSLAV
jgi:hypothetical protein